MRAVHPAIRRGEPLAEALPVTGDVCSLHDEVDVVLGHPLPPTAP